MTNLKQEKYDLLIIEFNKSPSNIYREICAYITGVIGDCEVGSEFEESKQMFEDIVIQLPDCNGYKRPVSTYLNPNYINNGAGYSYPKNNYKEKKNGFFLFQKHHIDMYQELIKNKNTALKTSRTYKKERELEHLEAGWTEELILEEIKNLENKILEKESLQISNYEEYISYNAIAISFKKNSLTGEVIRKIKEETKEYIEDVCRLNIEVENFKIEQF